MSQRMGAVRISSDLSSDNFDPVIGRIVAGKFKLGNYDILSFSILLELNSN